MTRLLFLLAIFSVVSVILFYFSGSDIVHTLSPQGCRMSWMSPSYVLQSHFDHTWSPLTRRYSLWLYREVGWENTELHGSPVLFIPGNAGSSHQVRSIASSAARQYYHAPYLVASEFHAERYSPLDFFALEFNEDLSAFHGPTLDSEKAYAARAIDYILSLYPPHTSITIMAHSMGGIVATALLPHPNISAIITMSTPHTLPPARFDRRVDRIYSTNSGILSSNPTPILSLCGGATDLMIPSESCILPQALSQEEGGPYRRTVFTSALEGSWTGVGHREMVWCHQVRWRVARAALELAAVSSSSERATVLDKWLRDGHTLPAYSASGDLHLHTTEYETLRAEFPLVLKNPRTPRVYLFPVPRPSGESPTVKFVIYVSQGSIGSVAPQLPLPLHVSVYLCPGHPPEPCTSLEPTVLKLIPAPVVGQPFPVPNEGTDESEGIVLFEAEVSVDLEAHVAVSVNGVDGRGWVVGGFVPEDAIVVDVSTLGVLISPISVAVPHDALRSQIRFPRLLSNALLVYRLTPVFNDHEACEDALLPPLLQHTSHPSETHYFPLAPRSTRPILLHTHASAPYIGTSVTYARGVDLVVYSSGECSVAHVELRLDWWGTLGRWGARYATAAASWAVGIVALLLFNAWRAADASGALPDVRSSLDRFARCVLPWALLASYVFSLVPLPAGFWLGNRGEPIFAPIAPLLLLIVTGLVFVSWWTLSLMLWPLSRILGMIGRSSRRNEDTTGQTSRNALLSIGFVSLLIFVLVPWQVAFLGCWIFHFYTCATSIAALAVSSQQSSPTPVPLAALASRDSNSSPERTSKPPPTSRATLADYANANMHLLLFMTWLLPLAAPVLAVWVRTLATAGFTTPFDGDHNFLYVAPFLVLVEFAGAGPGIERRTDVRETFSPRWGMAVLACVAFVVGPRTTYAVFDVASAAVGWAVIVKIGPRYWGRDSWNGLRWSR
ncbi:GPI inositol-deacylase [Grifola frondosa]|uniref:GPI inositol-deacylase n=1 Tax=Grifola frondosa TaxID=5627 RepID=A0A1C7LZ84_GRIFR|nr:GPI inositol-deacylase [Grifola frondosa]